MPSGSFDLVNSNSIPNNIIENDSESESGRNSERRVATISENIRLSNFYDSNILQMSNVTSPNMQSVFVHDSANIQFGNKTIYKAPVTIQQFFKQKSLFGQLKFFNKKVAAYALTGILICFLLTLVFLVLRKDKNRRDPELRFITREGWGARPPKNMTVKLELPANRVIISHAVTPMCIEKLDCASQLQSIQNYHMDVIECNDIGYNFLIGGDGIVYIGRGWDIRGEHTYGYNARTIGVQFIGTFTNEAPPKSMLDAALNLMDKGVELKKLTEDYLLYGQRQMQSTESPGQKLYEIIINWKHWTNKEPVPNAVL